MVEEDIYLETFFKINQQRFSIKFMKKIAYRFRGRPLKMFKVLVNFFLSIRTRGRKIGVNLMNLSIGVYQRK